MIEQLKMLTSMGMTKEIFGFCLTFTIILGLCLIPVVHFILLALSIFITVWMGMKAFGKKNG